MWQIPCTLGQCEPDSGSWAKPRTPNVSIMWSLDACSSWPTAPVFPGQSRFGSLYACPGIRSVLFGTPKCHGLASEVPRAGQNVIQIIKWIASFGRFWYSFILIGLLKTIRTSVAVIGLHAGLTLVIDGQCYVAIDLKELWGQMSKCLTFCPGVKIFTQK